MFEGESDDDEFGVAFSFAKLQREEAHSTAISLRALESQMYSLVGEATAAISDHDEPAIEQFRRFEATGYEAHTDCVEMREIKEWQGAFPYLRVEGSAIQLPHDDRGSGTAEMFGTWTPCVPRAPVVEAPGTAAPGMPPTAGAFPDEIIEMHTTGEDREEDFAGLVVVGRRLTLVPVPGAGPGLGVTCGDAGTVSEDAIMHVEGGARLCEEYEGDEDDVVSGVLEEVLDVDVSESVCGAASGTAGNSTDKLQDVVLHTPPLSPYMCQRHEVTAVLADAVWPDCVSALLPVVAELVAAARETGLTYPEASEIEDKSACVGDPTEVISARGAMDEWNDSF